VKEKNKSVSGHKETNGVKLSEQKLRNRQKQSSLMFSNMKYNVIAHLFTYKLRTVFQKFALCSEWKT